MKKTVHCFVSGRVQGVCFRMETRQQAKILGLTGWVRNLEDGRVEVMASGDGDRVEELRSWLTRGPRMAQVQNLECSGADYEVFPDFNIRY